MGRGKIWLLLGCFPALLGAKTYAPSEALPLHEGWEFTRVGEVEWLSATVPGTIHQDLLAHDKLPDPFYGQNEALVQWVEEADWAYRTTFCVTEEQLARDAAVLTFEGLDTYSDIYLNGAWLKHTDNMFVGYTLPVKDVLRVGENRLQVVFRSPIGQTLPRWETNGFEYPADNDSGAKHLSIYSRKAPYSYGWDWGIRLVTCGIWRPVTLTFYDVVRVTDYAVRQVSLDQEEAQVENRVVLEGVSAVPQPVEITVTSTYRGEALGTERKACTLQPGTNEITLPLDIPHPHRWMPNGWGEPALYDFTVRVSVDGIEVDSRTERIGFRTVELVREQDAEGETFYFVVNGIPLFAKGANFVPADALLPRVTEERYRQLFADMKDAYINLIRVWGGGIYEDDAFYRAADENGILVWQDFVFACTSYPSDPVFLEQVEEEAAYNIKRLRNHPSLALWCGNNEIYEAMRFWGWQRRYADSGILKQMEAGYDKLFRECLPAQVHALDSGRAYIHTSPLESNWARPGTWKSGDVHNWGIWHGKKPFESLDGEVTHFVSEFGFQSFPEMKTLATFAQPEDYALESDVMNAHQKARFGNALIKQTMERYYRVPTDFDELVYLGQVLQGRGVRHGVEAHRRNRPYCMGSLYWQLNDSWPVVSWSSIDYYGNWKALHYQIKRAFAPVLVNAVREGDDLCIYVVSDELEAYDATTLQLRLLDFNGKILAKQDIPGEVPANASVVYFKEPYTDKATDPTHTFLLLTLKDKKGEVLSEETYYFNPAKDLELPKADICYKVKYSDGQCEVTLSSGQLARDVFVEIPAQGARFTDNFFDLLPGKTKKIVITSGELKKDEPADIRIHCLENTIN